MPQNDWKYKFGLKDKPYIYLMGLITLIVMSAVFVGYYSEEWHAYQAEFKDIVGEKLGAEKAESVRTGLQQIYIPALNKVDRCVTCHQGMEWKGLENVAQPYRSHPKGILEKHPLQKFGCTICHGGQGYAADQSNAHGPVEHWEDPLLGKEMADFYVIGDKKAMMELNCNQCHRYERETKGMDYINYAKKLVAEKNCRACHKINGRGGTIGPDLSTEGDKNPEQNDYERLSGYKSLFTWHINHFKNPKSISPVTIMPNFNFSSKEAQALTLLVMSWKRQALPVEYIPGMVLKDVPTAEELEHERQMMVGEGSFFVKKNCFACHSVTSLGVNAAAQIGPDLALAYTDVQARFGRTLEDFLNAPTGTMEVVLSTQIILTKEEKQEAINRLKYAYEKKMKEQKVAVKKLH